MGVQFSIRMPLAIKRVDRRTRLNAPAFLLTSGAELAVRLRDLSPAGALAEAPRPPAEGSEVVLICSGITAAGSVAWVVGRRFGLTFHEPIPDGDVALLTGGHRLA